MRSKSKKATKRPPPIQKRTPPAQEVGDMLDRARDQLASELDALDTLSRRAIHAASTPKKYSVQLGSHVAFLATKRAEIISHLRQLEKHDRLVTRTPEQRFKLVVEFVRALDAAKLAELELVIAEAKARRVL